MPRVLFHINRPLAQNEVLCLRKGVLYKEESHLQGRRFFLIRLFTNHRYDQNKILAHLFERAAKVDQAAAQVYLDTADILIKRAEKQNPLLSKYRIIRWLKGTPVVNCALFEQKLKAARDLQGIKPDAAPKPALNPEPNPNPEPVKPDQPAPVDAPAIPPLNKEYTKAETLALMREALAECPHNFAHYRHLKKWIIVCENRETIIQEYLDAVKRVGRGHWYNERFSGYVLHGELQDPIPVLRNGSEFYAMAYDSVRNDPEGKADFFANVFSGGNACYEGNYTTLKDWYAPRMHKNQDLILALENDKNKYVNLGEMHRVYNAYKFREYFKVYHDEDGEYNDLKDAHKKIYEEYMKNPNPFMTDFKDSVDTKANLLDFIREKKWLPTKCNDLELTEENIEEQLNDYYEIVIGE
jgi:hypothetical protein